MVLYTMKWNIHPDKTEEYMAWAKGAIQRTLGVGDVIELRAYRPASGVFQVVLTLEFADMAAWSNWYSTEVVQTVFVEMRTLTTNATTELWGPSPVVPQPIRPGG